MSDSYPLTEPYDCGELGVGDGHVLYWETAGNPDGLPGVWLHGGPGSGSRPGDRRHFDPATYRVVLFDQRGCERSRPLASDAGADLTTNTTDHLIRDLERLREHLGISSWVVAGISWGVTLGLAYAQRHPDRVLALVLAAVTTGTLQRPTGSPGTWVVCSRASGTGSSSSSPSRNDTETSQRRTAGC